MGSREKEPKPCRWCWESSSNVACLLSFRASCSFRLRPPEILCDGSTYGEKRGASLEETEVAYWEQEQWASVESCCDLVPGCSDGHLYCILRMGGVAWHASTISDFRQLWWMAPTICLRSIPLEHTSSMGKIKEFKASAVYSESTKWNSTRTSRVCALVIESFPELLVLHAGLMKFRVCGSDEIPGQARLFQFRPELTFCASFFASHRISSLPKLLITASHISVVFFELNF